MNARVHVIVCVGDLFQDDAKSPAPDASGADDAEPEPVEISFDDYVKSRSASKTAAPAVRKAGEGEANPGYKTGKQEVKRTEEAELTFGGKEAKVVKKREWTGRHLYFCLMSTRLCVAITRMCLDEVRPRAERCVGGCDVCAGDGRKGRAAHQEAVIVDIKYGASEGGERDDDRGGRGGGRGECCFGCGV